MQGGLTAMNQGMVALLQNNYGAVIDNNLSFSPSADMEKKYQNIVNLTDDISTTPTAPTAKRAAITNCIALLTEALFQFDKEISDTTKDPFKLSPQQYNLHVRFHEVMVRLKGLQMMYNDAASNDILYSNLINLFRKDNEVGKTVDEMLAEFTTSSTSDFVRRTRKFTQMRFEDIKGINNELIYTRNLSRVGKTRDGGTFVILTGPPGTGKTLIARALVTQHSGGHFYNWGVGELSSKTVGETETGISGVFEEARTNPATNYSIVLDEFDNLFHTDQPHLQSAATTIQTEIEGNQGRLPSNLLMIAVTNYLDFLPDPIQRRAVGVVLVGLPDRTSAFDLFFSYYGGRQRLTDDFINAIETRLEKTNITHANLVALYQNAKLPIMEQPSLQYYIGLNDNMPYHFDPSCTKNPPNNETIKTIEIDTLLDTPMAKKMYFAPNYMAVEKNLKRVAFLTDDKVKEYIERNQV